MRDTEEALASRAGTVRAFVAVNIGGQVRDALAEAQDRLRGVPADVSWVRPANLHLTLKFLGAVGRQGVERVTRAVERAAAGRDPFSAVVGGFGVFPPKGIPRVVWAGVREGAEALAALQRAVDQALASLGFPRESRRFTPHLTLGRVRSPRNAAALARAAADLGDTPLGEFPVTHVGLMRSQLDPRGSIYTVLRRIPLGPAAQAPEA